MDAVRGIETILCLNKEFIGEWVEYLAAKNNSVNVSYLLDVLFLHIHLQGSFAFRI